jgi:hypothetical protein
MERRKSKHALTSASQWKPRLAKHRTRLPCRVMHCGRSKGWTRRLLQLVIQSVASADRSGLCVSRFDRQSACPSTLPPPPFNNPPHTDRL